MSNVLDINELRRKRAKAIHEARAILERAEENGRDLDAEEERQYQAYIDESNRLAKQIQRAEEIRNLQKKLEEPAEPASRPDPRQEIRTEYSRRKDPESPASSEEYRDAFFNYLRRDRDGLDIPEARALSVGTASAGGYLVPVEFEKKLINKMAEINVMRQLSTVITTSGDHQIPVISSHGSASWLAEGSAYTDTDEAFNQVVLKAYKGATLIKVSEELLADSAFDLEAYIVNEFARRLGLLEEAAFINGDGVGKPKGVIQSATQGVVAPNTQGYTASISIDMLLDLYFSLKPGYRQKASWLMHDSSVKIIAKLKDSTGQFMWQPGLQAGMPDTIKGRPVYISDSMPVMAANAKSILFGDFSYYWIADRKGISFQRLNELYAGNGQVGFRGYHRTDGALTLSEAVVYYQNAAS